MGAEGTLNAVLGSMFFHLGDIFGIPVSPFDLILVFTLFIAGFARQRANDRPAKRLAEAIAISAFLFVLFALLSGAIGILRGNDLGKVLLEVRPFLYFLVISLIMYHSGSDLDGAINIALLARGLIIVLVYFAQHGSAEFLPGWESADSALFTYGLFRAATGNARPVKWVGPLVGLVSALILLGSGRRAPAVAAAVSFTGLVGYTMIRRSKIRLRIFAAGLVVLIVGVLLLATLPISLSSTIQNRFQAMLFSPQEALSYRPLENAYAIRSIESMSINEFLFGKGLGTYNAAEVAVLLGSTYDWYAIHNSWLQLMLLCGVIGVALFLNLSFQVVRSTLSSPGFRGIPAAFTYLSFLVGMATGQWLWSTRTLSVIAVLTAAGLSRHKPRTGGADIEAAS